MRIEIVDNRMGFDMKLTGAPQELARAVDFLKVMIPKRCRRYAPDRQTWRIEKRAAKRFNAWLSEMHGPGVLVSKRRVTRPVKTLGEMVRL
jgi:hypothetical protein